MEGLITLTALLLQFPLMFYCYLTISRIHDANGDWVEFMTYLMGMVVWSVYI